MIRIVRRDGRPHVAVSVDEPLRQRLLGVLRSGEQELFVTRVEAVTLRLLGVDTSQPLFGCYVITVDVEVP